jgi:hypothetical protein
MTVVETAFLSGSAARCATGVLSPNIEFPMTATVTIIDKITKSSLMGTIAAHHGGCSVSGVE